ncbi:neutral zinc metallopeptidase [Escherichia coli]
MQQQGVLETGDLEEALNAAQAIGDDRLQQQSQGRVVPRQFHSWHFSATLQLV